MEQSNLQSRLIVLEFFQLLEVSNHRKSIRKRAPDKLINNQEIDYRLIIIIIIIKIPGQFIKCRKW